MRFSEQKILKTAIANIRKYIKSYQDIDGIYKNIDNFDNLSLQSLSFKKDLKFFEEINSILSVISSIVTHPFILNKGEETILRADKVGHVQPQSFINTLKDSSLWRNRRGEMIPESIHHYENVDEIIIYENIFIVMLINLITIELRKHLEFYQSVIQPYNGVDPLINKEDFEELAILEIDRLFKKLRNIKESYFYKVVSRAKPIEGHIIPTNILKKNRLYNLCYKFFLKLVTYEDKGSLMEDLALYHYINILSCLKLSEYKIYSKSKNNDSVFTQKGDLNIFEPISLLSKDFKITVSKHKYLDALEMNVINRNIKDKSNNSSNHLLIIESESFFTKLDIKTKNILSDYDSIDAISVWNIAHVEYTSSEAFNSTYKEKILIKEWINSKISQAYASYDVYSSYCPICKKKNVDEFNMKSVCDSCGSKYVFYKEDDKDKLWFIKIGRC